MIRPCLSASAGLAIFCIIFIDCLLVRFSQSPSQNLTLNRKDLYKKSFRSYSCDLLVLDLMLIDILHALRLKYATGAQKVCRHETSVTEVYVLVVSFTPGKNHTFNR